MSVKEPHECCRKACFVERRKNHRLMVRLNIVVRVQTPVGTPAAEEKTVTRDISSGDLYFESSLGERLRVGDVVDVDIEPPVRGSTIFSEKHLAARGRVARIGPPSVEEPNCRGVAIVFLEKPAFHASLG